MNKYIQTDLAKEIREAQDITDVRGISYSERKINGITVERMNITSEEGAKIIGKSIGKYITVDTGKPWLMGGEEKETAIKILSRCIRDLAPEKISSVLVCGLGNRDITSDSLGPLTVDGLGVTRHIKHASPNLFSIIGKTEIASLCPGVLSQTGIETVELIEGAIKAVKPDLLVVIDALAARSSSRLASTFQFTDTGISPGSGIGNRRKSIDPKQLGIPVIAIGVPTVVNSSTLVYDALYEAGIEKVGKNLKKVLENHKSFFVSLKESDIAVKESAEIISNALNKAFTGNGNHIMYR